MDTLLHICMSRQIFNRYLFIFFFVMKISILIVIFIQYLDIVSVQVEGIP